jgi:ADP-heptose:LPS heptosyltransferase
MRLRRLEAASRGALVGLARRLPQPSPLGFGPGAPPVRVLYLRYDRIGDMILSTGLLRAIARSHANVVVDVLASPENAPVLIGNPYVRAVIVADSTYLQAIRRIRRERYDAVLDCQVFSPSTTTLIMMLMSRARHRIGLAGRGVDAALTVPTARDAKARHYVEHLGALATPFGVCQANWRPEIFLTAAERAEGESRWHAGRRLLVNISAGKPTCRWPAERFAAVLGALRVAGLDVGVVAAPADAAMAEQLAQGNARFLRTRSVREAFALVATADYVLTPDTAITHAASAFGKPAVVMFPRNRAEIWGPYQTGGIGVASTEGTLQSLPVEPVLGALTELCSTTPLDARKASGARLEPRSPAV